MPIDATPQATAMFGLASGLLTCVGFIPYVRAIVTGRARPCRTSWLIWSILGVIAIASLRQEGAGPSLIFAGAQVGGTILVFLLAIGHGRGATFARRDIGVLIAAAAGLGLWAVTSQAGWALAVTIAIGLLGGIGTMAKAYRAPNSEPMLPWAAFLASAGLGVASVDGADPILLSYPLYLLALYSGIVGALIAGRRAHGRRWTEAQTRPTYS
ncbi:hypothetical protein [Jannaschia pagri]|nr:hypothetical protein [Jannaschia sp. AI_62]